MKLTNRERVFLIMALLTLYVYVYIGYFLKPTMEKISEVKYNILINTRKCNLIKNTSMEKLNTDYQICKSNYQKYLDSIPYISDSYRIIDDVIDLLNKAGSIIDEIYWNDKKEEETQKSHENNTIQALGIGIKFSGNPENILKSLYNIENLGMLKKINKINISFDNNTVNIDADIDGLFLLRNSNNN